MFNLRPSPVELLTAAARAVAEWNPHDTSGPARAEVLLAGRAAALALRELCSEHEVKQTTARDIVSFYGEAADDSGQQEIAPLPLWARLAKDIRAGQFDDGPDALAVHALLTAAAGRWLQLANPKYAGQRTGPSHSTLDTGLCGTIQ